MNSVFPTNSKDDGLPPGGVPGSGVNGWGGHFGVPLKTESLETPASSAAVKARPLLARAASSLSAFGDTSLPGVQQQSHPSKSPAPFPDQPFCRS